MGHSSACSFPLFLSFISFFFPYIQKGPRGRVFSGKKLRIFFFPRQKNSSSSVKEWSNRWIIIFSCNKHGKTAVSKWAFFLGDGLFTGYWFLLTGVAGGCNNSSAVEGGRGKYRNKKRQAGPNSISDPDCSFPICPFPPLSIKRLKWDKNGKLIKREKEEVKKKGGRFFVRTQGVRHADATCA